MQKNLNIEILRTFAMLGVIFIHCSMSFFYNDTIMKNHHLEWSIINFYYSLARFCVPSFFLITAYLYFVGNSKVNTYKKFKRIFIPYFIWSVIYWWINDKHTLVSFFTKIFCDISSYHLWFMVAFLGYAIVLPLIMAFSKTTQKEAYKPIIFFIFLFSIILPSLYELLDNLGIQIRHLSGFDFEFSQYYLYALVIPFITRKINRLLSLFLYFLCIILTACINIKFAYQIGRPYEYWFSFTALPVFVSSCLLFNLFINLDFSFIEKKYTTLLYILGECTFGIYLCHVLVIQILGNYSLLFHINTIIDPIVNTLLVFTVSFFVTVICRKIKYVKEAF
ncbi:acyltransferase [Commensalibacter oyaizuii]|uniref:Acyltransferase family protein n=1 Tax=Commensalibacter oyaizuii TaxID=3043873 RepID=A0ABT6PZC5_9PROT|nr:acyltransferase family protein [Commensalibacter sp. TBRC 16381]MDI2090210.1 acyltransferase family protein [Commensalibacter sp. TBRC 16381]